MKKLSFLFGICLLLAPVSGDGNFLPAEPALEEDDGVQNLLQDSEGTHRRMLETGTDRPRHLTHAHNARNLTQNCGNGSCSSAETASMCPEDCANLQLRVATSGARGAKGAMFYAQAKRDLSVHSLDIYTWSQKQNERVQVYARRGKYLGFEVDQKGWTLVYNRLTNLRGGDAPTTLRFQDSVPMATGAFQSFFVWIENDRVRYRAGSSEGAYASGNNMLNVYEGGKEILLYMAFNRNQ